MSRSDTNPPVPKLSTSVYVSIFVSIALVVIGLDQWTKYLARTELVEAQAKPLLGSALQLYLIYNPGAAFSLGTGSTWIFTIFATLVVIAVCVIARKVKHVGWAIGLGLLVAGAAGNLIDRYFRPPGFAHGHVTDFLMLPHWPIFNVADMSVCTAAGLLGLLWLRGIGIRGKMAEPAAKDAPHE